MILLERLNETATQSPDPVNATTEVYISTNVLTSYEWIPIGITIAAFFVFILYLILSWFGLLHSRFIKNLLKTNKENQLTAKTERSNSRQDTVMSYNKSAELPTTSVMVTSHYP
ncbi:uncharacterized protein LOC143464538 [Clavelina lepadiformis]|uniref:ATP synthase F0 subunit 8 n=1 Tax=Clavelina lepadiformis TaxID=159417 RepID=A0ABP0EWQ8_CLALP